MTENTDYKEYLKRSGLKNTKNRTAILYILEQKKQPISAEDVFLEMKQRDMSVHLSTVYRTLDALADKDMVIKLNITGDNRALFEYNHMVHKHYLVCLGCKKIITIDRCPLENYEHLLEKETDYTIIGHKLDLYGYCPECKEKGLPGGVL